MGGDCPGTVALRFRARRFLVAGAVLASLGLASAALANVVSQVRAGLAQSVDDTKVLSDCLASAGNLEPACIGLVANACLNTADSTERMADCEARELKVWDAWLDRDYLELMARLPPAAKTKLRSIERAFVADTDRRCRFIAVVNGPTTMNGPHVQECRLRATATQWLWLKDFTDRP
jgi:uncharacterized protein YecT (DUF1311 family)